MRNSVTPLLAIICVDQPVAVEHAAEIVCVNVVPPPEMKLATTLTALTQPAAIVLPADRANVVALEHPAETTFPADLAKDVALAHPALMVLPACFTNAVALEHPALMACTTVRGWAIVVAEVDETDTGFATDFRNDVALLHPTETPFAIARANDVELAHPAETIFPADRANVVALEQPADTVWLFTTPPPAALIPTIAAAQASLALSA